ncbi:MAG: hypothetical protein R2788_02760 [Saprospiraceae bacterium]
MPVINWISKPGDEKLHCPFGSRYLSVESVSGSRQSQLLVDAGAAFLSRLGIFPVNFHSAAAALKRLCPAR